MKSRYPHIIFDLDGTLSDSREGIFNAYYHTAAKMGLDIPDPDRLHSLIGPPLQKGFKDVFNLQEEGLMEAVKCFREYYGEKGLYENRLYEGIPELLAQIGRAGASAYVATSKYELYAERVLEYFNIRALFTDVAGADYNGVQAGKAELVLRLMQRNGITDPADAIIIGDTRFDIETAAELEIDSVGVSYGFSSAAEIEKLAPDYIVHDVRELAGVLFEEEGIK
jgi:phosphoglycolate phosphatase